MKFTRRDAWKLMAGMFAAPAVAKVAVDEARAGERVSPPMRGTAAVGMFRGELLEKARKTHDFIFIGADGTVYKLGQDGQVWVI